jgi:hypothetical protein
MKYQNQEIKNVNHLAKLLILSSIVDLEDQVYQRCFGGLNIMDSVARQVLKDAEGFEISDLESELLIKTLQFEVAKVIGKLENQTGIDTKLVARNRQGYVSKQAYGL